MKNAYSILRNLRSALALGLLLAGLGGAVNAQTDVQVPAGRPDQTIQRIRTEDAGSRIDEVRVGGQTQSITVQPKTGDNIPAYEVKPSDTARGAAPSTAKSDTTGSRVWNVLKF